MAAHAAWFGLFTELQRISAEVLGTALWSRQIAVAVVSVLPSGDEGAVKLLPELISESGTWSGSQAG